MIWVQEEFVAKNLDSDLGVMAPLTKKQSVYIIPQLSPLKAIFPGGNQAEVKA